MRLFYAIPLPGRIAEFQAELKGRMNTLAMGAKWPRPQGLHLTLAFLGEQPEARLPELLAIGRAAASSPAFELRSTELGGFPRTAAARILWLGVEPEPAMDALCAKLRAALLGAGIPFDAKPFRPHITLARLKSPGDTAPLGPAMEPLRMKIDSFVRYQSTTDREGPRYEVLEAFPLSAQAQRKAKEEPSADTRR